MESEISTTNLPEVPFSIYFLNDDLEVWPKRMFTVTRKCEDEISLYIAELEKEVVYDYYRMDVVRQVWPN